MDALDLIEKLKFILSSSEQEAVTHLKTSSLSIDERFHSSLVLERSLLRLHLNELVADLEALEN